MLPHWCVALLRPCLGLLALNALFVNSQAQEAPNEAVTRVVQRVDDSARVVLRGNTHPLATPANDRGPAPASMTANRLLLLLQRSAQQEAELKTYLRGVQDQNSPDFHKWLSPDEFGRRFGISDADLANVRQWLVQEGFTVNRVSSGRLAIEFSGTFGQVESAFHTSLHQYIVNGEQHWANASDPQIPAALAPVVAGVVAMHNFSPRSQVIRGPSGRFDARTRTIRPSLTTGNVTNGYTLWIGPADAATIYDTPTIFNANQSGTLYDGTGITIGIAGDSNIDTTQNDNYRATFGLPVKPTQVIVDGTDPGENGDAIEAYLDTEVSAGIAPGANVVLYTAADTYLDPGLFLAIIRAIDDNGVDILNVSFSGCEAAQGTAGNQYIYDLWQQAAAQGISVTVSTGDSGSAGCDNQNTETYAQYGLAVNGLASTPYNIAVGGTDFDILYSNFPTSFTNYVNIGNSLPDHRSALSYIPEEPWNDSTFQGRNGTIANNLPWAATNYPSLQSIVAGGGGASACVTMSGTTCLAGYQVPVWQSASAADNSGRNLPDVSFLAGNGLYGAVWALCTDQDYISATQTQPDCAGTPTIGNNFNVTGVGGTSASAPTFAGMLALAAQKVGGRLGQADYVLYDLAKTKYSTVFHDVTTGNNSVSCTGGTPNCIPVSLVNAYYLSGFNTSAGYDEASGLGSVDATQMLTNWGSTGATATTSSLTLNGGTSALTIVHGTAVAAQVSVSGSGGTPSGPIALVDNIDPATLPDGGAIASFPLSSGSVDQTVNNFPGGTYNVSAHYGGDSTFAESDSNSIPITVNPESSSTDLKVRAYYDPSTGKSSSTPYYGFIYLVDAQPYGNSASLSNPNGVATGTVTFTSGNSTLGTANLASNGIAELQTSNLPGGTDSLKASFPGDASFQASTSSAVSFTVQPAISSLTMTTDKEGYNAGDPVTITASFASSAGNKVLDSLGAAPTGTVTFVADGSNQLGTASVTGTAGTAASLVTASATYTTKGLAWGSHNITATYSGDNNYASSSSPNSVFIQVISAPTTISLAPASGAIKQNQPLQLTANLTTAANLPAPTGTVTFSVIKNTDQISAWSSAAQISNGVATVTVPANALPLGTFTLSANYGGDNYYGNTFVTGSLEVTGSGTVNPTLSLTLPSAPVNEALPITLTVSGPSGNPVPTGSVIYSGNNGSWPLVNGSVSFTASYPWQPGPNTIIVTYLGDTTYAAASASGTFIEMGLSNISVSPLNPTVYVGDALTLSVSVAQVTNLPPPTGTVALAAGSYASPPTALSSGSASITIPANTLPVGSDIVSVTYSGDANYTASSSSDLVQVTSTPPGFALKGNNLSFTAGSTGNNTSTISVTPAGGFTGQVTLTATITAAPTNAVNKPTLSFGNTSPVTIYSPNNSGTATLTVTTTASTSAMLVPARRLKNGWVGITGPALGCVLLLMSRKRRRWQRWLGVFALCLAILSGISACGSGGGGSNGDGGGGTSGTTPGIYTITITGTSSQLTANTMISVTVN
jgi:trimeric autotransporter adhesin